MISFLALCAFLVCFTIYIFSLIQTWEQAFELEKVSKLKFVMILFISAVPIVNSIIGLRYYFKK